MSQEPSLAESGNVYTVYTVSECRNGCGKSLRGKRPQAGFCSDHCRYEFHNKRKREIESPPVTSQAGLRDENTTAVQLCRKSTIPNLNTISDIEKHGISIARVHEQVGSTRVCRYWLEPGERAKAAVLLGWTNERHSTV